MIHIHHYTKYRELLGHEKKKNEFMHQYNLEDIFYTYIRPNKGVTFGTHEKPFVLEKPSINNFIKTINPAIGNFKANVIENEDLYIIDNYLTLKKNNKVIYKPTTIHTFGLPDFLIKSFEENYIINNNSYKFPEKSKLIDRKNRTGTIFYGTLLICEDGKSVCSYIEPPSNIFIAAMCILRGIDYIINNPLKGALTPVDLPTDYFIDFFKKFNIELITKEFDVDPDMIYTKIL